MRNAALPRRLVLRSGVALIVPVALAGLLPKAGDAMSTVARPENLPLSGTLAGWVVLEPDRDAMFRIVQLDAIGQPRRQVAAAAIALEPSMVSLHRVCERAHDILLETVARSWSLPPDQCAVSLGCIAHDARGYAVNYAIWVDAG